jgi:capsular polysaccharide transport system permease protein
MLTLRQEFASKELTSALGALESARAEARRQQIYIEPVVSANLPDKALYPKRLTSILIIFVSCFLIYSIALLLLAGVNEHAQA